MSSQLIGSNAVIAAQQFNPSVMSQLWLVRNGLATEDDFRQGYIFSDAVVQFKAKDFHFLVVPEQLQISPTTEKDREQEIIQAKVGAIVDKLPHTPYRAIGLNFVWQVTPDLESVREWSRKLFYHSGIPVFKSFDTDDANFGAYLSRDVLGCRLRLDIKPITLHLAERHIEQMHFSFNFNLELTALEDPVEAIHAMLGRWNEAKMESIKIVQSAEKGQ